MICLILLIKIKLVRFKFIIIWLLKLYLCIKELFQQNILSGKDSSTVYIHTYTNYSLSTTYAHRCMGVTGDKKIVN